MVNSTGINTEYCSDEEYYNVEKKTEVEMLAETREKIESIILNIKSELISYSQNNSLPLCEYLDTDVLETFIYNIIN